MAVRLHPDDRIDASNIENLPVAVNGSNVMKVKFPGGESDLILDPDPNIPVLKFTDTTADAVKAGSKVRVQGVRNAEGATVNRITALP